MKRAALYAGGTGLVGLVMNVIIAKVHYEHLFHLLGEKCSQPAGSPAFYL